MEFVDANGRVKCCCLEPEEGKKLSSGVYYANRWGLKWRKKDKDVVNGGGTGKVYNA